MNRACYQKASGLNSAADSDCVKLLNHIVQQTGAAIVVSSSWRIMGESRMRNLLRDWGVRARILGVTPRLNGTRGDEIDAWLEANKDFVDDYVIIDDDKDVNISKLVQTNFEVGLTPEDAEKVIERLGKL